MSYQPGQLGNLSNMPNSSSWGLPTSWDFSKAGAAPGTLGIVVIVVVVLIAMHLMGGRRRRR